jgi:NAD(P)-dependent dehydrogenase (short-subunit alcohol dehydrogenase family)
MSTDRIVVITGGAGALGSTLAKRLAGEGCKIALFDVEPSKGRLDELVKEIGAGKAMSQASDFASDEAWSVALDAVKARFGAAPTHAALIAGGWAGGVPVHETKDDATYQRMITTNVDSTYRALRSLLPAMVAAGSGSIVVVGSRAVERPWTSPGDAAYAASKAAVVTIAKTVAQEVIDHGVRINAILPSTMDTPANRAAMPEADRSRWVSLSSAAGVISFLLGSDARDVSGAVIPVYGRA